MKKMKCFSGKMAVLLVIAIASVALCVSKNVYAEKMPKVYGEELKIKESGEREIAINIKENPGLMGFKIRGFYEPSEIEMLSVSQGELMKSGTFAKNVDHKKGTFEVLWANVEDITEDGTLFYVKVKLKKQSMTEAEIRLSYSREDTFNEVWEDVVLDIGEVKLSSTENGSNSARANKENEISGTSKDNKEEKNAKKVENEASNREGEKKPSSDAKIDETSVGEKQENEAKEETVDGEKRNAKEGAQDSLQNEEQKREERLAVTVDRVAIIGVVGLMIAVIMGVFVKKVRKRL